MVNSKATLSIFYGQWVLRRDEIVPNEKKKPDIWAFFPSNNQNFQNVSNETKMWPLKFFFSNKAQNLSRDPSPIEYTEKGLGVACLFIIIAKK